MSLKSQIAAILAAGCVSFVASGTAQAGDAPPSAGDKWGAWTEFGAYGANHSEARRGEATLWAPLMQDENSILFTDIRGRFFDAGEHEGNIALGYRTVGDFGWNPGIWIGYDRRRTEYDSDFNQISFGFEALSADWDVRLNGYAPLNNSELIASAVTGGGGELEVIGNDLFVVPGASTLNLLYELAFWGVDLEVGYRIPLERWGLGAARTAGLKDEPLSAGRYHDLRVFAGAYYFDNTDFNEDIAGPRLRAEWRIENIFEDWNGSRLTFEAGWQHDDVRDNQLEAGLRLRIPLGGRSASPAYALSPQEMRMTEGLKRDRDIVTETVIETSAIAAGPPEPVEDAVTGVDFDSITFVNNGDDLNAAFTGAGGNALLVALGGSANFFGGVMVDNQTVLGGGGLLQVRSRTTGLLYTYAAPGTRPTFEGGQPPTITAANNAHIQSVNFLDGANAIFITGTQRVVVDDARISGASNGIFIGGSGANVLLRNSTISGGQNGIFLEGTDQTLRMENTVISNMTANGIRVAETSGGVTPHSITAIGNTFSGTFGDYLFRFDSGDTNLVAGSTGNVDAAGSLGQCIRDITVELFGEIAFVGVSDVNQVDCFIP